MTKKYHVTLTDAERTDLHDFVHKGTVSARKLTRAHILLHADAVLAMLPSPKPSTSASAPWSASASASWKPTSRVR